MVNKFGGYYEAGGFEWTECERAFRQVMWAEREFWPKVGRDERDFARV